MVCCDICSNKINNEYEIENTKGDFMKGFFWLLIGIIIFVMFCYYMRGGGDNNR